MKSRPLLGLFLAALATIPATAADGLLICDRVKVSTHPWSWESIKGRYSAEFVKRDYPAVFEKMKEAYRMSPQQPSGAARDTFVAFMEEIGNGRPCCDIFKVDQLPEVGETGYSPIVLFPPQGKHIELDCRSDPKAADQMDEIRYFADAFVGLGRLMQAGSAGEAARRIESIESEFDTMLKSGFPMYPWEAWVTSVLMTDDRLMNGPPSFQAILFHPTPGVEVHLRDTASSRAAPVMAVETTGLLYYPESSRHKDWWGFSALTTYRGDMGVGVGAAIRRDNLCLGITWHDTNANHRQFDQPPYLSFSLDLYQALGERFRKYSKLKDKFEFALQNKDAPK